MRNLLYRRGVYFIVFVVMKKISSRELRNLWKEFRLSKQHIYLPESSLIGGKESTAMFTIAGMQQLIPYLSGKEHPLGKKLFNIQKCIRTVDIDEVGDASHLTFFEMMGNRSLGEYFKKEAVQRSWEFLVDVLKIDSKKLAVTVFAWDSDTPKDEETAEYWKKAGMPVHKIAYMWAENNRRSPGPVWPCGPDTEIFYRVGETEFPSKDSNPQTDEDNWLEIWNNVFMQFYRDDTGKLTKLKNQNVDTGMWFERMTKVLQGAATVFDTDIFAPLINIIERTLDITYMGNERRCRIVADHIRTSFSLISNDIIPSNEWRWYVLRRLIRRMYYNFMLLKSVDQHIFDTFVTTIVTFVDWLIEAGADTKNISTVIIKEAHQFQKTIVHGQKLLDELISWANKKTIFWKDIFKLYDTFGFPFELTKEILEDHWFSVDVQGFEKEMEAQQERSRAWSKDMFKQGIDRASYTQGIVPTKFVWYETLELGKVKLLKDFEVHPDWLGASWQRILVFDSTPFYAESWGQMWDRGVIELDDGSKVNVIQVQKYNWIFLHFVK